VADSGRPGPDPLKQAGPGQHAGARFILENNVHDNLTQTALTPSSAEYMRGELTRVEGELGRLDKTRADLVVDMDRIRRELASLDMVRGELDETADRYRQRLGGAVSLLPAEQPVWPQPGEPCECGDSMQWSPQQNGFIHPLGEGGFELAGKSCRRVKGEPSAAERVGGES